MYENGATSNGGLAFTGMGLATTGVTFQVSTFVWVAIAAVCVGLAVLFAARRARAAKVKP